MNPLQPDFIYIQNSGMFFSTTPPDGCVAYSGHGPGRNNPNMENVPNVGPLPRGWYRCGEKIDHTHLGPDAVPLQEIYMSMFQGDDNAKTIADLPRWIFNYYKRNSFFAHGDDQLHDASLGCLILPPSIRALMTPEKILLVISAPERPAPSPSVAPQGQQTTGPETRGAQS